MPDSTAAGQPVPGLVLDLDASIVICHSEKESATPPYKKTFGYHPLFCFLDGTLEALSGLLREGRAGSNTTADHITVLDQIPDAHRYGTPILIRSDSAGCTQGFLTHIRSLREHGINTCFSVGVAITEPVRAAIRQAQARIPAIDTDGELRDGAEICEITGLVPATGYPEGTRFIVRRERPHPGAQLSLFDTIEGMRHQVVATDAPPGNTSHPIPRSPPPRPCPCRRPHPDRQRHRLRPVPLPRLHDQPGLAGTGPDRHRPARLDPNPAPGRRTRRHRTEETSLPPPARRGPPHPLSPTNPAAYRRNLALGNRSRRRVHPPRRAATPE
jgi:hypothetical protein